MLYGFTRYTEEELKEKLMKKFESEKYRQEESEEESFIRDIEDLQYKHKKENKPFEVLNDIINLLKGFLYFRKKFFNRDYDICGSFESNSIYKELLELNIHTNSSYYVAIINTQHRKNIINNSPFPIQILEYLIDSLEKMKIGNLPELSKNEKIKIIKEFKEIRKPSEETLQYYNFK